MLSLYKITFDHYGPKDSKEGIEEYVIADDEELVVQHMIFAHILCWEDWEEDGDEMTFSTYATHWDENPDALDRADALGLKVTIGEWGSRKGKPTGVKGKTAAVARWLRADPRVVEDVYYGRTVYAWDAGTPITDDDAATLVRLGIAKNLTAEGDL